MANEHLFPELDWSKWNDLSEAHNNQRYDTSINDALFEKLRVDYSNIEKELSSKSYIEKGDNVLDWMAKQNKLFEKKNLISHELSLVSKENVLNPYNYVPPRHALEPHLGFEVNPNNAYRFVGEKINVPINSSNVSRSSLLKNKTEALKDFLSTGQIRGNPNGVNGGRVYYSLENKNTYALSNMKMKELPQAYFMPRHPQPAYYTPSSDDGIVLGQNTMIEINKDFASINQTRTPSSSNPLYYMGNEKGVDAREFRAIGGSWRENTGAGAHITVNPKENLSFTDMVNPANRKGIRILQETTPALSTIDKVAINQRAIYGVFNPNPLQPYEQPDTLTPATELTGTAPEASKIKWNTKYDRITPFLERPMSTHKANLSAEAEIFLNAVKAKPIGAAVAVGGKALLGAGIALETMRTPDRIQSFYENALRENPNWKPDISDKLGMSAYAGLENAASFASLGTSDDFLHPEWRKKMEPVQRGYYSDNGQRVPNWFPNLQSTLLAPPK